MALENLQKENTKNALVVLFVLEEDYERGYRIGFKFIDEWIKYI